MSNWLKEIDLDTFRVTATPLTTTRELPRGATITPDGILELPHEAPRALQHGDDFTVGARLCVFLTRPARENDELVAHIDERPDDDDALKVWADWLLEHGDPLGEQLLLPTPAPWVLEGLESPGLELTWHHGLITAATLRSTPNSRSPAQLLLRLQATRVFRWVRSLTIDCAPWRTGIDGVQQSTSLVLRALLEGPPLTALQELRFGTNTEAFASTALLSRLTGRLRARFPALQSNTEKLLAPTPAPALEITRVPEALDFYAPEARSGRLGLANGAWAGSSSPGQLRLLSQGVHRGGVMESFLIERAGDQLSLFPVENVLLNGRPAIQTRLLDGDLIEEPRGAAFRFRAD